MQILCLYSSMSRHITENQSEKKKKKKKKKKKI